jgi:hypothetical protein
MWTSADETPVLCSARGFGHYTAFATHVHTQEN